MRNIFKEHEKVIQEYCVKNKLDFEKARKMPKSCIGNTVHVQYFSNEVAKQELAGIVTASPMPVVLKITETGGRVTIEQTTHTSRYLAV